MRRFEKYKMMLSDRYKSRFLRQKDHYRRSMI